MINFGKNQNIWKTQNNQNVFLYFILFFKSNYCFYIIKFLSIKFRRSLAEASRARLLQRLLQMASAEASAEASADGCFTGGAKQHRGWNWFRMNFETLHTDQVKINDLALQNYAKHFENEFKVHSVSMKFIENASNCMQNPY